MPLSKRQKRRLLEVSKMIESSIVVRDDMEEIQLEYAQELEDIAASFHPKQNVTTPTTNEVVPAGQTENKISKAAQQARNLSLIHI